MYTFNEASLKSRRQELRKNQTPQETELWNIIRNKKVLGLKFFRQYSVGSFILDFYCPLIHLAIEVDSGQHNEPSKKEYDLERSKFLESKGIITIRFWNNEITENIEGVFQKILETITKLKNNNSSQPPLK